MIKSIKRIKNVYLILNLKWWHTMLATILGFLDSLSNVLLLLGIGEFVARQLHTSSTKGNLLKVLFGEHISELNFNLIFISILILKALTISSKYFLNEKIKLQVERKLTLEMLDQKRSSTHRKILSRINNLISKGIIGLLSDFFFITLVFGLLMTYDSYLALSYLAFVCSVFSLATFFINFNNQRIHDALNRRSKYRKKEKEIERKIDDLIHTDRFDKEINILKKRFNLYEEISSKKNKIIAISEAISPITFFTFLVIISFVFSQNHTFSSSTLLEIILLLIYSQGPIRRILRVPRYWISGSKAMQLILEDKVKNEPTFEYEKWSAELDKIHDSFSSVITKHSEEYLNLLLSPLQREKSSLIKNIRFFDTKSKLAGDSLLSSISFKSRSKESEAILNLANLLKLPKDFIDLLENNKSSNNLLSTRFLFYAYVLMCEIDHSEIVFFTSDFSHEFIQLKETSAFALKKTYICL